ncbi:hypothetical protein [Luteolibacter sp. LG18]|uniref:hypothetical protein n=1 Tax=Luteolibacter sp. LG18 TaxID=2819286 RepID=UPI002B2EC1E0|nr:hypothetical protein llg_16620 [Luteolibacter sp. LG18]
MHRIASCLIALLFAPGLATADAPPPAQAEPADKAPAQLRAATQFTIGGVGFAGTRSAAENAFRALLTRADAVAECKKLVASATPAGQLYGLLGLKLQDPKAFDEAFPAFKDSKAAVSTAAGCMVFETTVGQIAADIRDGKLK